MYVGDWGGIHRQKAGSSTGSGEKRFREHARSLEKSENSTRKRKIGVSKGWTLKRKREK
jgi:hypothetical protein